MAQKCPKCGKSVYQAEGIKAVGKFFHRNCLRCQDCNKTLASTAEVNDHKGEIYCKHCFAKTHGPVGFGAVGSSFPDEKKVISQQNKVPAYQGGIGPAASPSSPNIITKSISTFGKKTFSDTDIQRLQDLFQEFDANKSGTINAEGAKNALEKFGVSLGAGEINGLFDAVDSKRSGQIEIVEFLKLCELASDLRSAQKKTDEEVRRKPGEGFSSGAKFGGLGGGEKCPVCGKSVYVAEEVNALKRKYHKTCFQCFNCKQSLVLGKQVEHKGEPYCQPCYNSLFRVAGYGAATGLTTYSKPVGDQSTTAQGTVTSTGIASVSASTRSYNAGVSTGGDTGVSISPTKPSGSSLAASKKKFTDAEFMRLRSLFKDADANGSNSISVPEVKSCLDKYGMNVSDSDIQNLVKSVDTNNSGEIEFIEFIKLAGLAAEKSTQNNPEEVKTREISTSKVSINVGGGVKCPVCGKSVYQAEEVNYLRRKYHKTCFQCFNCKKSLELGKQAEHAGEPYCQNCYNVLFRHAGYGAATGLTSYVAPAAEGGASTTGASSTISAKSLSVSSALKSYSQQPTTTDSPVRSSPSGSPAAKFSALGGGNPKCPVCGKSVYMAEEISSLGQKFHKTCFRCSNCNEILILGKQNSRDGKLFCKKCHDRLFPIAGQAMLTGQGPSQEGGTTLAKTSTALSSSGTRKKFTDAEIMQLRKLFVEFDTDGSGSISPVEAKGCMNKYGIIIDDDVLYSLFKQVDTNQSGTIEFVEFLRLCGFAFDRQTPQAGEETKALPGEAVAALPPAVEEASQPPAVEEASQPPAVEEASQPPAVEEASQPPAVEEAAQPPPVEEEEPKVSERAVTYLIEKKKTAGLLIKSGKVYRKQDVLGKGDPYVVVKVGPNEKKTHTVKNTLNPVWNTKFTFSDVSDAESGDVTLTLYDEDTLTKNDLIGTAKLSLQPYLNNTTPVSVPVFDAKGEEQGKVEINAVLLEGDVDESTVDTGANAEEPAPEPEATERDVAVAAAPAAVEEKKKTAGILIKGGKVYKKQDIIGKGDPYVVVRIGANEKRTHTIKNTQNPVWNLKLIFPDLTNAEAENATLTLYDEDTVTKNDLIGTGKLSLLSYLNSTTPVSVPVYDAKGEEQGKIEINAVLLEGDVDESTVDTGAPAEEPKPEEEVKERAIEALPVVEEKKNTAVVLIKSGRVNQKQDILGKGDPFVVVKIGENVKRTQTIKNTQDPVWNERFTYPGVGSVAAGDVTLTLYDEDTVTKNDLIGTARLSLLPYLNKQTPVSVPVVDEKGVEQGKLEISVLLADGDVDESAFDSDVGAEQAKKIEEAPVSGEEVVVGDVVERSFSAPDAAKSPVAPEVGNKKVSIVAVRGKVHHKQDVFGKGDPFLVVKVGNAQERTQTAKDTLLPLWNQDFSFDHVNDVNAQHVTISLYDEDSVTKNDLIGQAKLSVLPYLNNQQHLTLPILDGKGVEQALVEIDALIEEEGVESAKKTILRGILYFKSGKVYKSWDVMGKGDPYVVAKIGAAEHKTSVKNNTQTPIWNERLYFDNISEAAAANVSISLYDYDAVGAHDFIGSAVVSLLPYKSGNGKLSLAINDKKGKEQAMIELELELKTEVE